MNWKQQDDRTTDVGQKIPSAFLDPGGAALAKIWPKANANPATSSGGVNYYQPIDNVNNGWVYRFRLDYQLGDNTRIYGSYQQAYDSELANGNGAHLYWTPGNAIPYPGGGEPEVFHGKSMAGHFVHIFNSTTTMDFMAAWAFGSFPFTQPDPSAVYRSTLGYPYGKVFKTSSLNIPAYSSAGNETFPDFSQASIFDNPPGSYAVRKEAPQFNLIPLPKSGARTPSSWAGLRKPPITGRAPSAAMRMEISPAISAAKTRIWLTRQRALSAHNTTQSPTSSMGVISGYSAENNSSPISDTAYQATAGFVDDTWKVSRRFTLDLGARIEHIGHWYDRDGIGMAVFYPDRVLPDYNSGKYAPGYYWHAIDAGVPLSGQPNRFAYFNPRLGMSYDVFGTGNTVVRGGWGSYRFVTQVNDVVCPLLQTAQQVLTYNLPGAHTIMLSQLASQAYTGCTQYPAP